jgi:hypothetical protein
MRQVATFFLYISLASINAQAMGRKGQDRGHQQDLRGSTVPAVNVRFGTTDVRVIQQYYRTHPVSLPPGLQKKLARGKSLPPGWQKKLQPFPSDIDVRLGPPCGYCGRGVIDGYGVVYDKKTAIILDVV